MLMFDPTQCKRSLDGDVGYTWKLGRSIEDAARVGGVASTANARLHTAIKCILVGYDEPARQLLTQAHEWLTRAIREREQPRGSSQEGVEAARRLDLALCNWLLNDEHDGADFRSYVENQERFLNASSLGRDKSEISSTMFRYVDAGAYREALARYAGAGLTPPASLSAIRTEGQMSYVLCRHLLGEDSKSEVQRALQAFLRRKINLWLIDGHALRAAEWMKIAYWNGGQPKIMAKEAVLKCYDYLPGVVRPA